MEKYTSIIIDDEPKAIESLKYDLDLLYKNIEITTTCTSWTKALETLRTQRFDIVFLDISMQDKNGMDLLKLTPGLQAEVIFITAYSDFALDAFRFSASGYIVKPIDEAELIKTVDKVIERIATKRLAHKAATNTNTQAKIGVPNNNAIEYVNTDDIICLSAEGSYTRIITKNSDLTSSFNIQRFKDILDSSIFYQVHRAYMINVHHIKRYEHTGIVIMDNNASIPISRKFRDDFLKIFNRVSNQH